MTPTASIATCGIDVRGLEIPGIELVRVGEDGLVDGATFIAFLNAFAIDAPFQDDYLVLELVAAWDRVSAWASARALRRVADFARRPALATDRRSVAPEPMGEVAREFVSDELMARLAVGAGTASSRVQLATSLQHRLPGTATLFASGLIDSARAALMERECAGVDDVVAGRIDALVADVMHTLPPRELRRRVRRHVLEFDPRGQRERASDARDERRMWVVPNADGMAFLGALLPADRAMQIELAVTAAARRDAALADPSDHRSLEQRKADLLSWPFELALATGSLAGPVDKPLARHLGRLPQIEVSVAASTLMGLDEAPGELVGYGPIHADFARDIAGRGTWHRLLTDATTGAVLDVGTTTYAPPPDLRRHLEARDRHCRFPGCARPAVACDADHTRPYPHGPTAHDNLGLLCRRHHRLKHSPGVELEQEEPGVFRWRLPAGHQYDVVPPDLEVHSSALSPGSSSARGRSVASMRLKRIMSRR